MFRQYYSQHSYLYNHILVVSCLLFISQEIVQHSVSVGKFIIVLHFSSLILFCFVFNNISLIFNTRFSIWKESFAIPIYLRISTLHFFSFVYYKTSLIVTFINILDFNVSTSQLISSAVFYTLVNIMSAVFSVYMYMYIDFRYWWCLVYFQSVSRQWCKIEKYLCPFENYCQEIEYRLERRWEKREILL